MKFEMLCIAGIITAFIVAAHFDEQGREQEPHGKRVHAAAPVKTKKAWCPKEPCLDVPVSCFVHGGAPSSPQCPRD